MKQIDEERTAAPVEVSTKEVRAMRDSEGQDLKGRTVALKGWLAVKRSSGKIGFLRLRDGHGTIQVVMEKTRIGDDLFAQVKKAPLESPIILVGEVASGRDGKGELMLDHIEIHSSSPDYPLGRKDHGPDFLLEHRHLWIRSPKQAALLRIRSQLEFACMEFLQKEGFYRFDSPLLTPTACEGTTDLFEVDYFGSAAYLSQSGQLYSEAGIGALEKVYTLGPCFRAEKSKTRRHLTEFWGVEPEMAWVDAEENIRFQERFLRGILKAVAERCEDDLQIWGRKPEDLLFSNDPFPVLTYDEALTMINKEHSGLSWGQDFGVEEESYLATLFDTPFFVFRYPVACRAFYIEAASDRPEVALSSDCLMPGGFGEIITGGQRTADREFLLKRIGEFGLDPSVFQWYLELRQYGSVEHSGFGMGIERMLRWICGVHHIRETIPFPRTLKRLYP